MSTFVPGIGQVLSVAIALAICGRGLAENIRIVGFRTDPVFDGAMVRHWSVPILNDRGELVTSAHPEGRESSLVLWNGAALAEIARQGKPFPNGKGVFSGFVHTDDYPSFQLNNTGHVAFLSASDVLRIYYGTSHEVRQLFPTDESIPLEDAIAPISLNDAGQVAFFGTTRLASGARGPDGFFVASDSGVEQRFLASDPIPGIDRTESRLFPPTSINSAGQIAFYAAGGMVRADSTSVDVLGGFGQPAAGAEMPLFVGFRRESPAFNDRGEAAFLAAKSLYRSGPNGPILITEPGFIEPDSRIGGFESPTINNLGQVAFLGNGIFRTDDEHIEPIVVPGQTVPGIGTFQEFRDPAINDRGQLAFYAATSPTGSEEIRLWGIHFYDDELGLRTVIREGDELLGRAIEYPSAYIPGRQSNLFDSGFNQFGQVAFAFTLDNRETGVALWSPYPDGDFTADSIIDQADLDLVLSGWGTAFEELPDAWRSNPPGALVDQAELDDVLSKWGTAASEPAELAGVVPEPATSALLCLAVLVGAATRRKRTPR